VIFRESFWVVVGGTAPVIALAVVVSMGDMQTPVLRINTLLSSLGLFVPTDTVTRRRLRSPDLSTEADALLTVVVRKKTDRINKVMWPMLYLALGNLSMQAALLCVGLLSIALQTNLIPPWIAVLGETVGVIVLAVIQFFIMNAKGVVPQMEKLDSLYYPESQQQDPSGTGS
jgi:uncharacterized membrane protein YhaH (DUF805 family)